MSVLVLDPEVVAGEHLQRQLSSLGYNSLCINRSDVVARMSAQGDVDLVICCDEESLTSLCELPCGVGVVFASRSPLTLDTALRCMRFNVQDCWELPLDESVLEAKVSSTILRNQKKNQAMNAELLAMRGELERDQRAGQYIQMGMLPPNPMGIGHYRLQHKVEPSLILSGDFIDYFQITDRYFACYVADVAGHGASSAFVTVLLKNFSRRLRREYRNSMLRNPGEVLAWINSELLDQGFDKHVAMFFGIVDMQESKLRYANAAQLPPAMIVVDGKLASLEQKGRPLGLFADLEYETKSVDFPVGAKVVVFSDGVLDLISEPTLEAKEKRLGELVTRAHSMDVLWASLDQSQLGLDDVSCLLLHHES